MGLGERLHYFGGLTSQCDAMVQPQTTPPKKKEEKKKNIIYIYIYINTSEKIGMPQEGVFKRD